MNYDDWKTESREDERERWLCNELRQMARRQWLEDHADEINEERRERRREED